MNLNEAMLNGLFRAVYEANTMPGFDKPADLFQIKKDAAFCGYVLKGQTGSWYLESLDGHVLSPEAIEEKVNEIFE